MAQAHLGEKRQLQRLNPEIVVDEVHGNVNTRIRKLEEGHFDGVVLAYSGIKRLGLMGHVAEVFSEEAFYPAPGQGTIVAESREEDPDMEDILNVLDHKESRIRLECERSFLRKLEGGCQLPCGISTALSENKVKASGILFSIEDRNWADAIHQGSTDHPEQVGEELAELILERGGLPIIQRIREATES